MNALFKIPRVKGAKGGGGKGGGGASNAPNTLRSKASASILDMISEGPIRGLVNGAKSIYLDRTPLMAENGEYNFEGVTWETRQGLPEQDPVAGFSYVSAETNVGVLVKKNTPVTRSLVDPGYEAASVTIRIPSLFSTNRKKGNLVRASVSFRIEARYYDGPWQNLTGDYVITGKNTSPYDKQFFFMLPQNPNGESHPWDVRVTRITNDNTADDVQNDIYFAVLQGIINQKFSYPHTAYAALTIDAEQFGSSAPQRAFEVYGLLVQIPSNYDPDTRQYTGIWDGTFKIWWTNNPAWIFYDLIVNDRYGLGTFIRPEQVDKWSLYEIAQYCDGLVPDGFGGYEPRFVFNGTIREQSEAYEALAYIAGAFRGMAYWSSGTIVTSQDRPKDPVILVTPSNVVDGTFNYPSSALKARHTVAMVSYQDPNNFYDTAVEMVQDDDAIIRYGYRVAEIKANGCTSRGQAHRMGLWTILTELMETSTVNYKAGLDHASIRPGDVVAIQDPSIAGNDFGGRVSPIKPWGVELDFAAKTYTVNGDEDNLANLKFARSTVARYWDGKAWVDAKIDEPRISAEGLVYEPAATNYAPNSVPSGGTVPEPGHLNYGWDIPEIVSREDGSTVGVEREIVGFGNDAGMPYVDVRFHGTVTAKNPGMGHFTFKRAIPTKVGDQWTSSLFFTILKGDTVNSPFFLMTIATDADGNYTTSDTQAAALIPLKGRLATEQFTSSLEIGDPASAFVESAIVIDLTYAPEIDVTMRIGLPQIERGMVASSPIKSYNLPTNRAADVLTLPLRAGTYDGLVTFDDGTTQALANVTVTGSEWVLPPFSTPKVIRSISMSRQRSVRQEISLDHPVTFEVGKDYTISVVLPDGRVGEGEIAVTAYDVPTDFVQLIAQLTVGPDKEPANVDPDPFAMWVISSTTLQPALYRIVSIKESEPHMYEVMGLQYEPGKFDAVDFGAKFELIPTSELPKGQITPPSKFTYKEWLYLSGGDTLAAVTLSCQESPDKRATTYQWQSRHVLLDGSLSEWENLGISGDGSIDCEDIGYGMFDFRVRAVSSLSQYSTWLTVSEVPILGITQPPPDPIQLRGAKIGDQLTLTWSTPSSLGVMGYELKFTPALTGYDWGSAVTQITNLTSTTVQVHAVQGTYMVKAYTSLGVYSSTPAVLVFDTGGLSTLNAVEMINEAPDYPGEKVNLSVIPDGLVLDPAVNPPADFNMERTGVYKFNQRVDLGDVYTSRLSIEMSVRVVDMRNRISDWERLSDVDSLALPSTGLWSTSVYYRMTNDDPVSEDAAWVDPKVFQAGDETFRCIEFAAVFRSVDTRISPIITSMKVTVDMPDRNIGREDIIVPAEGLRVGFMPPFKRLKGLAVADQDMATGDKKVITDKDETGFFIQYFDASGAPISRVFDFNAIGYGMQQ